MPTNTPGKIKNFSFTSTLNEQACLDDFKGKKVVLFFYPKDNTPGCTIEAKDFTSLHDQFKNNNTVILGISKDSMPSHCKFAAKYKMPFALISDESKQICDQFNVLKEKSMFGRKYMGIERSTFLLDEQGNLIKEWRKVKVLGHAKAVLKTVESN